LNNNKKIYILIYILHIWGVIGCENLIEFFVSIIGHSDLFSLFSSITADDDDGIEDESEEEAAVNVFSSFFSVIFFLGYDLILSLSFSDDTIETIDEELYDFLLSDAKDGFEDDISVLDDDKDFELIVVDEEEEDATTEAIVVTNEELEELEDGVVVEVAFCIIKLS